MIYLDHGATSFPNIKRGQMAVETALETCANPGRSGHRPAMAAAEIVYRCRERAGEMFDCGPDRVVFTFNCTHGLNIAIRSLVKPGDRVLITGFVVSFIVSLFVIRGLMAYVRKHSFSAFGIYRITGGR